MSDLSALAASWTLYRKKKAARVTTRWDEGPRIRHWCVLHGTERDVLSRCFFRFKSEAVAYGRGLAQRYKTAHVVYNKDGQVKSRDDYSGRRRRR